MGFRRQKICYYRKVMDIYTIGGKVWDVGDQLMVLEGPKACQVFDKEPEGKNLGDLQDKYQVQGDVLQSGGKDIGPSGGVIKYGYQRIGND